MNFATNRVSLEMLAEEQFALTLRQRRQINVVDEVHDPVHVVHVDVTRDDNVDTLLPESILNLAALPLVDLVLGQGAGDTLVFQV